MDANFGSRIKFLRTQRNMTQVDLAKRLGVSKTITSAYETGLRKPSYDVLMDIALFFNVSMDFMFGSSKNEKSAEIVDLSMFTGRQRDIFFMLLDEFNQTTNKLNEQPKSKLNLKTDYFKETILVEERLPTYKKKEVLQIEDKKEED